VNSATRSSPNTAAASPKRREMACWSSSPASSTPCVCAVDVQCEMAARNADVPADKRIEFRFGIHQGDIIIDEGDIFGDGVNLATRLEGLAEPGGICISRAVRNEVRDKLDIAFADRHAIEAGRDDPDVLSIAGYTIAILAGDHFTAMGLVDRRRPDLRPSGAIPCGRCRCHPCRRRIAARRPGRCCGRARRTAGPLSGVGSGLSP
jgi:hypothetical protein